MIQKSLRVLQFPALCLACLLVGFGIAELTSLRRDVTALQHQALFLNDQILHLEAEIDWGGPLPVPGTDSCYEALRPEPPTWCVGRDEQGPWVDVDCDGTRDPGEAPVLFSDEILHFVPASSPLDSRY